uniref:Protocadherin Fat 1 n=1 Tax=Magallana gigas TaxID=29159 RepID=K1PI11_MAGGI
MFGKANFFGGGCVGQCVAGTDIAGKTPTVATTDAGTARTFIFNSNDEDYKIKCCGFVASWEFYVGSATGTLYAQVWRPSGTDWELVGQNAITVTTGDQNALKTEPIDASQQIPVKIGDFIGFKSTAATIPMYYRTNNGVGSDNENIQFSDSATTTPGSTDTSFNQYGVTNIEFSLKANLAPGNVPTFGASPTSSSVTDDTAVGTPIATVTATDADTLDTLTTQWTATSPAGNSGVFNYDSVTDLTFTSTDNCGNTVTHVYSLTVTNYPPVFQNLPDTTSISEDIAVETQLKVLTVTDASLADTVTCLVNNINPATTDLYLRYAPGTSDYAVYLRGDNSLNYDTQRQYVITIDCTDSKVTVQETYTVSCESSSNSIEIAGSTTPIGTNIFTVTSTDPENDQLHYNMTCIPACPFKIYDSGDIQVDSSLSGLTSTAYDLFVYVYDGSTLVGPRSLTVKISDINTAPNITNLPSGIVVPENSAPSTTLYTLEKTDVNSLDTHTWTYSISSGGSVYFAVDSSGIVKTTSTPINYETITPKTFYVTAYVSDGQASASGTLTIDVSNVNEAPSFSKTTYSVTGNEGAAGATIGTPAFVVTDPEGDTVTYSLACPEFTLTSGVLTFTSDYDVDAGLATTVSCGVTVSDGSLTDTATLVVNINNINDNTPTFFRSTYSFYVTHDSTVGTVIADIPATDGDIGTFGEITYSIDQTSTGGTYFRMNSDGGLYVASDLSTFSAGTTKDIIITATDGGGLTDTTTVTIVIPGVTTTTVSTTTDRYMTFFEDTRNVAWFVACMALLVGLLILISVFIVRYGDFSWMKRLCDELSRKCRRKRRFKIRREPTEISYVEPSRFRFCGMMMYKTTVTLVLVLTWSVKEIVGQCVAGISNAGKTPFVDRTDGGTDNNYRVNCCGFVSSWTFYVGASTGTLYAQIWRPSGTDWQLVNQNAITVTTADQNAEKTEPIPADLQIPVRPGDFVGFKSTAATIPMYRKTNWGWGSGDENVIYSDSATSSPMATDSSFIAYTDNNIEFSIEARLSPGNVPTFGASPTSRSVTDDTAVGTLIATVTATDADTLDTLTTQWTATNPAGSSAVFNYDTVTGALTTTNQLPVGTTQLTFTSTDNCGNTDTHVYSLTVTNYPPVFQNLPDTTSISEDIVVETQLKVLTVTDASLADTVTCSINNINPSTTDLYLRYASGTADYAVYLRADNDLDYDTQRQYVITIDCTDTKVTVQETYTVYILRNQQPTITNLPAGSNSIEIAESTTPIGTKIFTVTSTDPENDQLHYNMTCIPACPFKIYDSGAILVDSSLSGLTSTAYDLFVYVYDGSMLVGPRSLTVKKSDINTAPNITNLPSGIVVPENSAPSTTLYILEKTDVNSLDTHTWTYSISSGGSVYFAVDSFGNVKTTSTPIDYETITPKKFYVTAYVSDGQASASGTLTIDVCNVNEAPSFSKTTYSVTGNEGAAGVTIGTPAFAVTDPERDTTTYSIDCAEFTLNPISGILTFTSDYDVDAGLATTVSCGVTVSDGSLTDTVTLVVNINNINDNTPTFFRSTYSFYVTHDSTVGTVIADIPATDGDIGTVGEIRYSINQTSTGGTYFRMNSDGGLYVASDLFTFSAGTTKDIIITATDGGGLTDTTTVTIVIPGVTTTTVSTTTDRYMTFFEDTRNVAWIRTFTQAKVARMNLM